MKSNKGYLPRLLLSVLFIAGSAMAFISVPGPVNAQSVYSDRKEAVVYITKTGKKYHRAGCRYLKHSHMKVSKEEAIAEGYTACKVCRP
jgi:hypothetical protein